MKYLIITSIVLMGCDDSLSEKINRKYHIECIHGVEYLKGTHMLTPHFNLDGTLNACVNEQESK